MRVEPEGEPPFEVEARKRVSATKWPTAGSTVPAWFDPKDHDRFFFDLADRAETAALHLEDLKKRKGIDVMSLFGGAEAFKETVRKAGASENPAEAMQAGMDLSTESVQRMLAGRLEQGRVIMPEQVSGQAAPAADPLDRLSKLKQLLDSGAITQTEFDAQKAKILNELP